MKKKLIAVLLSSAMIVMATACGHTASGSTETASSSSPAAASTSATAAASGSDTAAGAASSGTKTYHVGIIQQLEHPALDKATEGFEAALNDKFKGTGSSVEFDLENAQGEQSNCTMIANNFVSAGDDLIMANATSALIAAAQATGDIPIVGTSITDYVTAGVIDSNDKPGRNVTGASDLAPVDQQIALLQKVVPDAKQVAILYCSAEPNSLFQAQLAEKYLDQAGIKWKEYTAADSNEVQAVVTKAIADCNCVYIPTDNTMANNMEIVKNITIPAKIPVICGEENMCKTGGLATLSISYYDMGYAAGEMAYDILVNGKNPGDMPIQYVSDNITPEYNPDTAKAISWDMSVLSDLTALDTSSK
ncbi:MAG: ABC transporter substrate-binding protein [Butyrivibrio sp.]|nr:ABC transporter substrate-binding protein [Butyrivibrio sp.]